MVEKKKINIEDLTEEQKEELWKAFGRKEEMEDKEIDKEVPKVKPTMSIFIPLGENYNAKFVLWDNNLQVVKSRKKGDEWEDYQTINLSKRLLTELMPRIPAFILQIDAQGN